MCTVRSVSASEERKWSLQQRQQHLRRPSAHHLLLRLLRALLTIRLLPLFLACLRLGLHFNLKELRLKLEEFLVQVAHNGEIYA
jgi:hypothetical protein